MKEKMVRQSAMKGTTFKFKSFDSDIFHSAVALKKVMQRKQGAKKY